MTFPSCGVWMTLLLSSFRVPLTCFLNKTSSISKSRTKPLFDSDTQGKHIHNCVLLLAPNPKQWYPLMFINTTRNLFLDSIKWPLFWLVVFVLQEWLVGSPPFVNNFQHPSFCSVLCLLRVHKFRLNIKEIVSTNAQLNFRELFLINCTST